MVGRIYRRINEAYTVLRDDRKRVRYLADVTGPERDKKLRFTEAEEQAVQVEQKRKLEEQFGQTPNGRKLYATAMVEIAGGALGGGRAGPQERAHVRARQRQVQGAAGGWCQVELEKIRPKGDYRIK